MNRTFLTTGAILGAIAVALGAFGAHGLKNIVAADTVAVFQTGVQYQMYHTLAILIVAILSERLKNRWLLWAGYLFALGIVFFSGSLYLITALKAGEQVVPKPLGAITPFGGLLFICGWVSLLVGVYRKN